MKKSLVEFLGTFFLLLAIGCTTFGTASPFAPFGIAVTLMVVIYAFGHISGAHYNPAVTVAALLRGKCPAADVAPYLLSQIAGAAAAVFTASWLKGSPTLAPLAVNQGPALVAEFLFTFALATVILHVATTKSQAGNSFYGAAIGGTVLAGALCVGGISGGCFNPAVSFGLALVGVLPWGLALTYIGVQVLAGVAAALAFRVAYGAKD